MFKKVVLLASVTALAGLVTSVGASGCSSTLGAPAEEAGTDAHTDAKKTIEAGPEEDAGPALCPSTEPIDATSAPWSPPATAPGSCTDKMITDLVAFVDANKTAKYAVLKAAVTDAKCSACLFVKDGPKWGPFVENADGTFKRHNFGGCVAVTSGKESCGKAYSQFDDCVSFACQDCADSAAQTKCQTAASSGACKVAAQAVSAECDSSAPLNACDALAKTYTFEAASRALCVGLGDGGTDGGSDGGDAGDGGDGG